jgi:hypothetical protein
MKIYGFNSEFTSAVVNSKTSRSNDIPSPDQSSDPREKISNDLTASRGIVSEKDRIQLNINRAVVFTAGNTVSVLGNGRNS